MVARIATRQLEIWSNTIELTGRLDRICNRLETLEISNLSASKEEDADDDDDQEGKAQVLEVSAFPVNLCSMKGKRQEIVLQTRDCSDCFPCFCFLRIK